MRDNGAEDEVGEQPRRRHTVSGGDRDGVGAAMAAAKEFDPHAVGEHEQAIFLPLDLAKEQDGAAENGGVRILDHYAGRREPTRSRSWEYIGDSRVDGGSGEGGRGGGSGGQGEGYGRGRDDVVVSDNSFSRSSVAAAGGEDDYNGAQYEQDLEQAVAMLDGNFVVDEIDRGRGGVGGVVRWGQDESGNGRDSLNKSCGNRGDGGRVNGDRNFPPSGNSTLDENGSGDLGRGHRTPRFNGSSAAGGASTYGNGVDKGVHQRVESGTSGEDGNTPAGHAAGGSGGRDGSGGWGNSRERRHGDGLASDLDEGRVVGLAGDDTCGSRGSRSKHGFAFTDFPGEGGRGSRGGEGRGTGGGSQEGGEWAVAVLRVSECYRHVLTKISMNSSQVLIYDNRRT